MSSRRGVGEDGETGDEGGVVAQVMEVGGEGKGDLTVETVEVRANFSISAEEWGKRGHQNRPAKSSVKNHSITGTGGHTVQRLSVRRDVVEGIQPLVTVHEELVDLVLARCRGGFGLQDHCQLRSS